MRNAAEQSARAAIAELPGLITFSLSVDDSSSRFCKFLLSCSFALCFSLVNVSVWDSVEHANAMSTLPEMLALFEPFTKAGVTFERPIVNYQIDWQL